MMTPQKNAGLPLHAGSLIPVEPKDPIAHPHYPKRVDGARRPAFEVVEERLETENAGLRE